MRRKRQPRPLGATARIGHRTGAAETSWATAEAIADKFLGTFSDNCTDNRIKPSHAKVMGGIAVIDDLATGQPVPVRVWMDPSAESFHPTSLPVTGLFRSTTNDIVISPTRGACLAPSSWRNVLLSVIRHEMTHAADPGLYKQVSRLTRGQELRRDRRQAKREKDFCSYVQGPYEARAFTAQVATELKLVGEKMRAGGVKGFSKPEKALAAMSPTYREIEKCLTPKMYKGMLRLAARSWDSGLIPKALAGSHQRRRRR